MAEFKYADTCDIGMTAGEIWEYLDTNGASSLNKITTNLKLSRELALQAIGWLAREDKLFFEQASRGRIIRLK